MSAYLQHIVVLARIRPGQRAAVQALLDRPDGPGASINRAPGAAGLLSLRVAVLRAQPPQILDDQLMLHAVSGVCADQLFLDLAVASAPALDQLFGGTIGYPACGCAVPGLVCNFLLHRMVPVQCTYAGYFDQPAGVLLTEARLSAAVHAYANRARARHEPLGATYAQARQRLLREVVAPDPAFSALGPTRDRPPVSVAWIVATRLALLAVWLTLGLAVAAWAMGDTPDGGLGAWLTGQPSAVPGQGGLATVILGLLFAYALSLVLIAGLTYLALRRAVLPVPRDADCRPGSEPGRCWAVCRAVPDDWGVRASIRITLWLMAALSRRRWQWVRCPPLERIWAAQWLLIEEGRRLLILLHTDPMTPEEFAGRLLGWQRLIFFCAPAARAGADRDLVAFLSQARLEGTGFQALAAARAADIARDHARRRAIMDGGALPALAAAIPLISKET